MRDGNESEAGLMDFLKDEISDKLDTIAGDVQKIADREIPDIPIAVRTKPKMIDGELKQGMRVQDNRTTEWKSGAVYDVLLDDEMIEMVVTWQGIDKIHKVPVAIGLQYNIKRK